MSGYQDFMALFDDSPEWLRNYFVFAGQILAASLGMGQHPYTTPPDAPSIQHSGLPNTISTPADRQFSSNPPTIPNPPLADSAWQTSHSRGNQVKLANPSGAAQGDSRLGRNLGSGRANHADQSAYWCATLGAGRHQSLDRPDR